MHAGPWGRNNQDEEPIMNAGPWGKDNQEAIRDEGQRFGELY